MLQFPLEKDETILGSHALFENENFLFYTNKGKIFFLTSGASYNDFKPWFFSVVPLKEIKFKDGKKYILQ